jgi:hypothetical protein
MRSRSGDPSDRIEAARVSKESRRRQRAAAQTTTGTGGAASTAVPSTSDRPASSGATGAPRAGRRQRARPATSASFIERYRSVLVGLAVVAVVGIVGVGVFAASTQPVYACSTEWTPDPTPSPGANAAPQPGYPQPDMGQGHVSNGTAVTYTYCPPASGRHYNGTQTGPISARVYGPDDAVPPQGWIHNLEHGAIVVLYRGDSEGATDAGQAALRAFFESYPPSPLCGFQPGTSVGPVFARFDEMATPFAAMVWGRVLPLDSLDTEAILEFDRTYGERTNPESFCERPSPTPAPTASPSPDAS